MWSQHLPVLCWPWLCHILTTVTLHWHRQVYHSLHLNHYRRSRAAQHASSSTCAITTTSLHVWSNFTGYQFERRCNTNSVHWCTAFTTTGVRRTSLTLFNSSRRRQCVEVYIWVNPKTTFFCSCVLSLLRELSLMWVQLHGTACPSPSAERHLRQPSSDNLKHFYSLRILTLLICDLLYWRCNAPMVFLCNGNTINIRHDMISLHACTCSK